MQAKNEMQQEFALHWAMHELQSWVHMLMKHAGMWKRDLLCIPSSSHEPLNLFLMITIIRNTVYKKSKWTTHKILLRCMFLNQFQSFPWSYTLGNNHSPLQRCLSRLPVCTWMLHCSVQSAVMSVTCTSPVALTGTFPLSQGLSSLGHLIGTHYIMCNIMCAAKSFVLNDDKTVIQDDEMQNYT